MNRNIFWDLTNEERHLALDILHDSDVAGKHIEHRAYAVLFDDELRHLLFKWLDCNKDLTKLKLSIT